MPAACWLLLLLLYAVSIEECAAWKTTGRTGVLTAGSEHSKDSRPVRLIVCLFVCYCVGRPGSLWASKLPGNICSVSLERRPAMLGHIKSCNCSSKSIFPSFSYRIVPLERVQERTGRSLRRGKKLEWIDGRDQSHFSNSPQSETDFQQLDWADV